MILHRPPLRCARKALLVLVGLAFVPATAEGYRGFRRARAALRSLHGPSLSLREPGKLRGVLSRWRQRRLSNKTVRLRGHSYGRIFGTRVNIHGSGQWPRRSLRDELRTNNYGPGHTPRREAARKRYLRRMMTRHGVAD